MWGLNTIPSHLTTTLTLSQPSCHICHAMCSDWQSICGWPYF